MLGPASCRGCEGISRWLGNSDDLLGQIAGRQFTCLINSTTCSPMMRPAGGLHCHGRWLSASRLTSRTGRRERDRTGWRGSPVTNAFKVDRLTGYPSYCEFWMRWVVVAGPMAVLPLAILELWLHRYGATAMMVAGVLTAEFGIRASRMFWVSQMRTQESSSSSSAPQ